MKVGRELDRMIAEKVFGLDPMNARQGLHADGDIEYHWGYPIGHDIAPHFSTNISDAWRIVEKITTPSDPVAYKMVDGVAVATRFYYWFKEAELPAMSAQEAATEICFLALKALGEKVEEE